MRKALFSLFCALSMAVSGSVWADTEPVLNPYGRLLVGDGIEVEFAQYAKKNQHGLYDALIKMTGANAFSGGVDGATLRYEATHGPNNGINYRRNGQVVLAVRTYGGGWSSMQVFLDDKTISVFEEKDRSGSVRPLHLLSAWEDSGKK